MKTHKFACNKLIRDNILDRLRAKNITYHAHTMNTSEYLTALKAKIIEEAVEVQEAATHAELIEEIADVFEVLYALCHASEIPLEEIEQKRLEKRTTNGGFTKKIYCEYIQLAHDNPHAEYYKKRPSQYPEIVD